METWIEHPMDGANQHKRKRFIENNFHMWIFPYILYYSAFVSVFSRIERKVMMEINTAALHTMNAENPIYKLSEWPLASNLKIKKVFPF